MNHYELHAFVPDAKSGDLLNKSDEDGQARDTELLASPGESRSKFFDNPISIPPRFVRDVELAWILSISVHTVRKWRSQGKILPKQFGRCVRYDVDEVVSSLEKKRTRNAQQKR